MSIATSLPVLLIAVLAAAAGFLAFTVLRRSARHIDPMDWIDRFSTERYRPMLRLLEIGDEDYLKRQPGFRPHQLTLVRMQRARAMRGYLGALKADFTAMTAAIRALMHHSQTDRADLAAVLVTAQARFFVGLMLAHLRLTLYEWDMGTVQVSALVSLFDTVRLQVRGLAVDAA